MHHELAGELRRFMPKPVVDNVRFFAAIDDDRMFPPRRGAKSGRQRMEGSFEDQIMKAETFNPRPIEQRHTFASWYILNRRDLLRAWQRSWTTRKSR